MGKLEKDFQKRLKEKIEERFPGAIVQKMESYIQGWPDLLILYNEHWALLECKKNESATHQPNQDLWVDRLNGMSYAAFVYPENMEEVLDDLQRAFKLSR